MSVLQAVKGLTCAFNIVYTSNAIYQSFDELIFIIINAFIWFLFGLRVYTTPVHILQ